MRIHCSLAYVLVGSLIVGHTLSRRCCAAALDVPYYWQSSTMWCWSSSAAMVARYYVQNPAGDVQIRPWWAAGDLDRAWDDGGSQADVRTVLARMAPVYDFTSDFITLHSTLKSTIMDNLDRGHPVILVTTLHRHDVVVTGYSGSGDNDNVYINDPSGYLFKDSANDRLCRVTNTWAEFFDIIDTAGLFTVGKVIYANTSGSHSGWGGMATIDLCWSGEIDGTPVQYGLKTVPATTGWPISLNWDGQDHPGYYMWSSPSDTDHGDAGESGAYFVPSDTIELYPFITAYTAANTECQVELQLKDSATSQNLLTRSTTVTVPAYSHLHSQRLFAVPVSDFASQLSQEEFTLLLILRTRVAGSGTPFVESDRLSMKFRVDLSKAVTVQTSPPGLGLRYTADGIEYNTPRTFDWASGSSHTLSVPSPQSGSDS